MVVLRALAGGDGMATGCTQHCDEQQDSNTSPRRTTGQKFCDLVADIVTGVSVAEAVPDRDAGKGVGVAEGQPPVHVQFHDNAANQESTLRLHAMFPTTAH
jgi:hypothetical protein